ncbi:hypothetical protein Cflav_PD0898 [Pedosphaera parvula Ellin514]|uniref:Uncharacterized protein n=2 Tax=Pedosphaera TaxID=1032526 RepID=B9XQU1_PEDPL|nr:hypothetical protein Cflav_PD0898 [Pedosphaera parvula Ellin514]
MVQFVIILLALSACVAVAAHGQWVITQLPYSLAMEPSINNSEEIVWAQNGGGIYSSVRGALASSGLSPHLANSGEVVYADWFGGPYWDLVSTTRGRMTQGGIIDVNSSTFDVNALGEVVYGVRDTNDYYQVYSTVRGQITFGARDHYYPCINDKGEIVWQEYLDDGGRVNVSSIRGVLPGDSHNIVDLNNAGDFCSFDSLEKTSGYYTWPHLFSSAHGFLISDPDQFQFGGGINDAGTIVWAAQNYIYKATWTNGPALSIVSTPSGLALEWPTNVPGFHPEYTTNLANPASWQALTGNPVTNSVAFHLPIEQSLGNFVFFRLSNRNP